MSTNPNNSQLDSRTRLAHALGFDSYPSDSSVEPYLTYITNQHVGGESLDEWLELFIQVIQHFKLNAGNVNGPTAGDSIRLLIGGLALAGFGQLFADTNTGDPPRKTQVEDKSRVIISAYNAFAGPLNPPKKPYDESLAGLISGSGLLPGGARDREIDAGSDPVLQLAAPIPKTPSAPNKTSPQGITLKALGPLKPHTNLTAPGNAFLFSHSLAGIDAVESQSIVAIRLNAYTLSALSAVQVSWTYNISRHMLLAKSNGRYTLELFALPCAFQATTQSYVGVSDELAQEIRESYAMLFNAWWKDPWHSRFLFICGIQRWCWCWSCSARRYSGKCAVAARKFSGAPNSRRPFSKAVSVSKSALDPLLISLMGQEPYFAWTPERSPHLWSRIVRLEQHLQTSRPWSFWVLFRDRRDTFQFWTFLFATVVVFLTVVQVALGCAQVAGSFK